MVTTAAGAALTVGVGSVLGTDPDGAGTLGVFLVGAFLGAVPGFLVGAILGILLSVLYGKWEATRLKARESYWTVEVTATLHDGLGSDLTATETHVVPALSAEEALETAPVSSGLTGKLLAQWPDSAPGRTGEDDRMNRADGITWRIKVRSVAANRDGPFRPVHDVEQTIRRGIRSLSPRSGHVPFPRP